MNKMYEVPQEMRELADRSVTQARQAFDGFMSAVQKTAETVDGAAKGAALPGMAPARALSQKAATFAQNNVNAAFELAQKLVHAKDIQEIMAIQTAFLKAQMEAIQTQSQEIGAALQSAANSAKK